MFENTSFTDNVCKEKDNEINNSVFNLANALENSIFRHKNSTNHKKESVHYNKDRDSVISLNFMKNDEENNEESCYNSVDDHNSFNVNLENKKDNYER